MDEDEFYIEAWICWCLSTGELEATFDAIGERDAEEAKLETYNEGAWLRDAEYHPEVGE